MFYTSPFEHITREIVNGIMELSPRAAELTTLLESRISNFYTNFQVDEIGPVVSIGDGIARVYGCAESNSRFPDWAKRKERQRQLIE